MEEPPLKIHHLSRLAAKSGLIDELSEDQMDFIETKALQLWIKDRL